jgi:hypothetical protein
MKKAFILIAIVGAIVSSCRKIEVDGPTTTTVNNYTVKTDSIVVNPILEGRIIQNLTLKAGYTYKLRGLVYVTNGAILTIEPGTKIVGELYKTVL